MSARSKLDRSSNSPLYAHGIPIEAVKDRKKLKEFQSSKFEQYAINSKHPKQHYVVGYDEDTAKNVDETITGGLIVGDGKGEKQLA